MSVPRPAQALDPGEHGIFCIGFAHLVAADRIRVRQ